MLTGEQVRGALAMLRWSRANFVERSGIPARTFQRVAEADGLPNTQAPTLAKIQQVFEEAGVVFTAEKGRIGVSLAAGNNKNG